MQSNEQRRVIWRHPKGIYETVEVSGVGTFGIPYRYRETVYTANRDARGVAHKELAAAVQHPVKLPKRLAVTDEEEQEICELYAKQMFNRTRGIEYAPLTADCASGTRKEPDV